MPTIIDDPRDLLTATETDERTNPRPDSWIVRLPQIVELSGGETLTIDPATGTTSLIGLPGWLDGTATGPREDGIYAPDTTYTIVSARGEAGSDGTLNFVASDEGSQLLEFTPNPGFSGITELQIDIIEDQGAEGTGWITIAVDNQAPTAADSFFNVQEDTVFDLVGGANDPDGDEIWVASFEQVSGPGDTISLYYEGDATIFASPSEILYRLDDRANSGEVVIEYTLTDGVTVSETMTLTLLIDQQGDENTANAGIIFAISESPSLMLLHEFYREDQLFEISAGDTVEIDPLNGLAPLEGYEDIFNANQDFTIIEITGEAAEFAQIMTDENGAQKILYTPPEGFSGITEFEVLLLAEDGSDGKGLVTFAVDNLPPFAETWSTYNTVEDRQASFFADLSDPNGDEAWVDSARVVLGAGSVGTENSRTNTAQFDYAYGTPSEAGYVGIEYTLTDSVAVSDPEVTWTWAGENTAPIWTGPTEIHLGQGESATLDLLGNWIDPELHGIELAAIFAPDGVTLAGSLLTLSFDAAGTYRLAIGVTDEFGAQALELIDVTVSNGGSLPQSVPNTYYMSSAFSVWGSLTEESSNSFSGFGEGDLLTVLGGSFGWDQLAVDLNLGTAMATLPDGFGGTTQVMLEGYFSGGTFMLVETDEGTQLSFARYLAALSEGVELDQSAVNGVVNPAYLIGNGMRDFQIELNAMSGAAYANVVGSYEVAVDGTISAIEVLFQNAQTGGSALREDVTDGTSLGFFLVQDAADLLSGLKSSDTLDFVTTNGADANAFGGEAAYLSVNGQKIDVPVFHSIDHRLNPDGLQHVVSGVDPGGRSITIGFEDLLGGGDRDYQDVVFQVTALDAIV
ncbi:MAG: Ig-like domain-containing protein [Pseudomonadota bacterium]